jgi:pimeloyl-ACP methyl ester carboxylesterase
LIIRPRAAVVGGLRTHYLEAGEGPPLLLLPSMLVLGRSYRRPVAALAGRFRVLAPELPGSGHSARLPAPWSLEEHAGWVPRYMDAVGVGRALVIGHSNSAAVALLLAARQPERVSGLVLVGSIGARTPRLPSRVLLGRGLDAVLELRLTLTAWHHILYNACFHPRSFADQVWLAVVASVLEEAPNVAAPTLLAWGRRDHTMPLPCARRLLARLPGGELYVSEGSHDWINTRPAEFAEVVARFALASGAG